MILLNPGPMWVQVTCPTRDLLAPGIGYEAPIGTTTIEWIELPFNPRPRDGKCIHGFGSRCLYCHDALGTGPLYKTILRINSQLADLERSARAVVVRVATGVDDDHTIANIIV